MHLQQNRRDHIIQWREDRNMNIGIQYHIHCSTNTAVTIEQKNDMHSKVFSVSHSPTRARKRTPDKHLLLTAMTDRMSVASTVV